MRDQTSIFAPGTTRPGGTAATPVGGAAAGVPAANPRDSLIRLLVVAAAIVLLAAFEHALGVVLVVAVLLAMVMIHELGHFLVAKASGMKVTEYFLGFGPRIWSFRRGETEYGIKAIPAGGYVRITGMTSADEVDPADESRTYRQATYPRRLAVGLAGSAMHFVMAFFILVAFALFIGVDGPNPNEIGGLSVFTHGRSPAQIAGLRVGDEVVSLDGRASLVTGASLDAYLQSHLGRPVVFTIERGGKTLEITVVPTDGRTVVLDEGGAHVPAKPKSTAVDKAGFVGVQFEYPLVRSGFLGAWGKGGWLEGQLIANIWDGTASFFSWHGLTSFAHDVVHGPAPASPSAVAAGTAPANADPSSIVGIVDIASQAASRDVGELLQILAAVILAFGIINLFPMLPFDGGHVVIATYERLRSRRGKPYHVDIFKVMPATYATLGVFMVISLAALYLNILHPPQLPGG
ncbi:MAG TPA: site-2 protease family protein [Acidimicrobiales bacterium]|nr:site-2 protease family protein [Acidimicrobiales bacterium]